ncbi:MAG: VTT domain-containing protein [Hyphomonas sp.]|uniref:TVP38/TMEM64 family protein n=1 Tax=Hyphomonas sp. TaxID=87 RepID=UPI0034A05B15
MTDRPVPLWRRLWPVALIVLALAAAWASGVHRYLSLDTLREQQDALRAFVAENTVLAFAIYIAVYATATILMLPGALWITVAGGFLFGLWGGTPATIVGATLGASILFLGAKTSVGSALRERAGPFVQKLEKGFQEDAVSYMFALRFLPIVPFPVANIAPAIFGARFRDYVITTALGIVPGVIAYTWIGAGLGATFAAGGEPDFASVARNLVPAVIALATVSLLPVAYKKFFPKKVPA